MKKFQTLILHVIVIFCFSCSEKTLPPTVEPIPPTIPTQMPPTTSTLPASIKTIESTVPVFVGYTEKNEYEGTSFANVLKQINSMGEYQKYFGTEKKLTFAFSDTTTITPEGIQMIGDRYYLYESLRSFFQNGGGSCYILSVGKHTDVINANTLKAPFMNDGILSKEEAPTLVIVPDVLSLDATNCYDVYKTILQHCSSVVNRFAIFDLHDGFDEVTMTEDVENFRTSIGNQHLQHGAVYYPWVNSTMMQQIDFGYLNLEDGLNDLARLIKKGMSPSEQEDVANLFDKFFSDLTIETMTLQDKETLHQALSAVSPTYKKMQQEMSSQANRLPTAGILAGIYAQVDNAKGIWKAPANISLGSVANPTINISHNDQEDLNVSPSGKSINPIRTIAGQGVLVWGARTLDGNSLDWRYINVRRTVSMIEATVSRTLADFNNAPNTQTTWDHAKKIIDDYLDNLFREGALAGASKKDAYSIRVGLGETMTPTDILEGKMKVSVLVAVTRPAEFIEITIEQKVKK